MTKKLANTLKWIAVIVVVLGSLYAGLSLRASRALQRAYAALEADGRPMRAEQIIPPPVADADNAALLYKAATLQLKSEKVGEESLFDRINELAANYLEKEPPPDTELLLRELVQRPAVSNALTQIEQGVGRPACRFDLDYTKGAGMLMPHLSELRTLSRMVCAVARLQATDGNPSAAWNTVVVGVRLADALRHDPLLISQLVRIAQFSLCADTIQALCESAPPTAEQGAALRDLLTSFEDDATLVAALDGERLLLGEWAYELFQKDFRKLVELSTGTDVSPIVFLPSIFHPILHRDHAEHLRLMHAYTRNATQPYSSADPTLEDKLLLDVPRYCILTRLIVPAFGRMKERHLHMVARARMLRIGLALLRRQAEGGSLPQSLAELDVKDVVDPFSGQPFVFRAHAPGFTIYSVGGNQKDDGGTTTSDQKSGDIVWQYHVTPEE